MSSNYYVPSTPAYANQKQRGQVYEAAASRNPYYNNQSNASVIQSPYNPSYPQGSTLLSPPQVYPSQSPTLYSVSPPSSPYNPYSAYSTPDRNLYPLPAPSTPFYPSVSPPAPEPRPPVQDDIRVVAFSSRGLGALNDPENPNDRPGYSVKTLCEYALRGSPKGKLTMNDIYEAVEARFPYFRQSDNQKKWRNAARHDMSDDSRFKKSPRPLTEPGKGSYWEFDSSEVVKRNRRKTIDEALKQEVPPTPKTIVSPPVRGPTKPTTRRRSSAAHPEYPAPSRYISSVAPSAAAPKYSGPPNPYLPAPKSQPIPSSRQFNPYLPDTLDPRTYSVAPEYTVRYQPYTRRSSQSDSYR